MKKKIAVVTGSSRGIGAEIARKLTDEGFIVVVNYNASKKKALSLVTELRKKTSQSILLKADMRIVTEINFLIDETIKKFGRIDALIHNACPSIVYSSFNQTPWSNYQEQLDISVKAFYHLLERALPVIKKQKFGRIITIATALALNVPTNKLSAYITAKSALIGMSKALAVELAPYGITVNSVSPGVTNTDFLDSFPSQMKEILVSEIPSRRLAKPKDIAAVVSFLCSKNAEYITGINIPVTGGTVM